MFACPGGGTATVSRDATAAKPDKTLVASFRRCSVDGRRLDGPVDWYKRNGDEPETATFGAYTGRQGSASFVLTGADGVAAVVDGQRVERRSSAGRGLSWEGNWGLVAGGGSRTLAVAGMRLSAWGAADGSQFSSDFEMNGDATNGQRVPVATYAQFATDGAPSFARGYMQVLALNGANSASGKIAISPAEAGATGEFDLSIDTYRAPGDYDTTNARVPQSFGGGLLKLGAR